MRFGRAVRRRLWKATWKQYQPPKEMPARIRPLSIIEKLLWRLFKVQPKPDALVKYGRAARRRRWRDFWRRHWRQAVG